MVQSWVGTEVLGIMGRKSSQQSLGRLNFLDNHRTGKTKSMWALLRGGLAVRTEQGLSHKHMEKAFWCERTPPPNLRVLESVASE